MKIKDVKLSGFGSNDYDGGGSNNYEENHFQERNDNFDNSAEGENENNFNENKFHQDEQAEAGNIEKPKKKKTPVNDQYLVDQLDKLGRDVVSVEELKQMFLFSLLLFLIFLY